jgi:hypothetical protein
VNEETTMRTARLTGLLALAAACAPAPASAQAPGSAEQQLGSVQACRAIADVAQRVACYDRASAPAAPGAAPAQAARTQPPAPPPAPPPTPEQQFGHSPERARPVAPPPEARAARELDQITARIASLRSDALGRLSFVLDNGQVWRMTESEGVFDFPSRGDTVTIRRGAIGGFRLDWGTNVGVRVARAD